ncbi:glycoside hydrolase family 76 protein [Niabella drilacis]|uniref:Glycosyl hydrolase family 76 n=1 Tax=Niabella drilacis (strain DSM 25811 / CCM 8410 / CCUG 62505 / LMG 26954 / E90) TaxID=1285928 RepID=A0A1G6ZQ51_NIADE|nr:glycoside hydrolase family 76 protein [Niabella drilacis]SDE04622.1 Glycosyl hydrolase family 76 [Niabella drilacis]
MKSRLKSISRSSRGWALVALLFFTKAATGQQPDYAQEYALLKAQIIKHYYKPELKYYVEQVPARPGDRKVSYLWPLCALFEAYQAGAVLEKKSKDFEHTFEIIRKYDDKRAPAAGYASYPPGLGGGDRFYDDNQWIGITVMHQYEKTKEPRWLKTGSEIYRFMMTGYDTVSGGGLYWQEGHKNTKNTCSNGPGILLALQLYKATGDSAYFKTAVGLYQWVNRWLRTADGLYYDNLHLKERRVDKRVYSYNTGTMLEANVLFYEITRDSAYLVTAQKMAGSADRYFLKNRELKDNFWFNAVLLRGLLHLWRVDGDARYLEAFRGAVDHAITHKTSQGLVGKDGTSQNLVPQGGMLELLAHMAVLQKQGIIK